MAVVWMTLCVLGTGLTGASYAAGSSDVHVQTAETHSVELRVYVDKWAFLKWNASTQEIGTQKTPATELTDIMRNHIRAVIHGVNSIYSGLMEFGIHLDIRIASVHFVMDEVVTETTPGSGEVSNQDVLDRLSGWLRQRTEDGEDGSSADHTMLLTGLNITGNSTDADSLGVARLGGMCDERSSLSVVEFLPPGSQTILVVAHELGHSLNASHDGETNMTCSNNSFVMDAHVSHNSTNSYVFSSCSVHSIHQFLLHLDSTSKGSSCLSADRTSVERDEAAPALGSIISVDQLCQMELGPHSFLHRGDDFEMPLSVQASYGDNATLAAYSTVCTSVWCYARDNVTVGVTSAEGLVCGKDKVCRRGLCVESEEAIDVPDGCPYGDSPAYANLHENVSCPELAVSDSNASLCYQQFFRGSCCHSCASAHQEVPDCEYGDKAVWCATSEYPDVCHANDEICCASCLPFFNASRVGCEYGDKAPWCATEAYPYVCALNAGVCCASCLQYYNESRTGCEYGDKAAWCANLTFPRECYGNDHPCCASCPEYHNASNVDCEYGDKAEWCSILEYPRECYSKNIACCASCQHHYNESRLDCEYGDKADWCGSLALPRECYGNDEVCCATCPDFRNASNVGCEYGDKSRGCETLTYPQACYYHADLCCHSCRPFYQSNVTDCEYGDKADWCGSLALPRECYGNDEVCCATCPDFRNASNVGCEYGDKSRGCETLTYPQACYYHADLCCHSCRPFYQSNVTGCEYGDKAAWCRQAVAKDPGVCKLNSEVCCASCKQQESETSQDDQIGRLQDKPKDEL